MNAMKRLLPKFVLSLLVAFGFAAGASANEGGYAWDKFPVEKMIDQLYALYQRLLPEPSSQP
jgi:hypothetical protein